MSDHERLMADIVAKREMLAGPTLAGIRSLRITEHPITDEHIALLVHSPHWP